MALLPWGMARILGITTFLGIPTSLPAYVLAVGGVLLLAATALGLRRPRSPVGLPGESAPTAG